MGSMRSMSAEKVVRVAAWSVTIAIVSATGLGCWGGKQDQPQAISAGAFYQPTSAAESAPPASSGGSGEAPPAGTGAEAPVEMPSITDSSESLTDKLLAVPPTPTTLPAAGDANAQPGTPTAVVRQPKPTGTYMTLGGMLAEVNGTPIFASKVVRTLEPVLAAKAKELDPRPFELEARRLLEKQVNEYVQNELLYAAAVRNLDPDDKKIADAVTTEWRERRIRDAGGSLEQAKRAALQAGDNFDELVTEQNREFLVTLFREKKINPRISITVPEMRRYYRENVQRKFTQPSQVSFRLIRVDPARSGGKDAALAKIRDAETRVKGGELFEKVASEANVNDDASLRRKGGEVGPIDKGSFALENVEAAVFRADDGALTSIIEDRGGFYLAQVTKKVVGSVQSFDDADVQSAVRSDIYRQQQSQVQDQFISDQLKGSVVNTDAKMLQTAVDMVNQRYEAWRRN